MRSEILFFTLSVFASTFMVQNVKAAMPTSKIYQNCSHNETSFTEYFDKPGKLNKTRWNLWPIEFGWEKGQGFKSINDWTNIKGLGLYTNAEPGVQIPGSDLKGIRFRSTQAPCLSDPKFCTHKNYSTTWTSGSIKTAGCLKYGRFDMVMASINPNSFQFIVLGQTHSRNPWQEVDLIFSRGTGRVKANVIQTSIMTSQEIISLTTSANSQKKSSSLAAPYFMDDGAVHTYSILWHPDYLAIQIDGKNIDFVANSWLVPSEWLQFSFGLRSQNNPLLGYDDAFLYVNKLSYDSDISNLPKLAQDNSTGKYYLV